MPAVAAVDPFSQGVPQTILGEFLEAPEVCLCRFNPSGAMLATGAHAGYILLWDTDTWDLSRGLYGHVGQIMSLR